MGWLRKSLATFIAGVRLETQMDVHVMLQLNPGAELLVTPKDYTGSQLFSLFFKLNLAENNRTVQCV